MTTRKSELLGEPFGTACNRLRKGIMFEMARRLDMLSCYRCEKPILSCNDFSIEHKTEWEGAPDPVAAFFDISEIGFSHPACNTIAANKRRTVYASREERIKANNIRQRPKRAAYMRRKREEAREAL